MIPKFASEVPTGFANFGIGTLLPSRGIAANVIGRNAQNMDFVMAAPLKTVEGSDIAGLA